MMRRLAFAGVAAVVVLVAEAVVLSVVAGWLGMSKTLLLLLATSVLGGWLMGREGRRGWGRLRGALSAGRAPGREATDGLVGLAGGLLLAVPGFMTDVVGLLLLIPPVRRGTRAFVERAVERNVPSSVAGDLFGPRKVKKVKVARRRPATHPSSTSGPNKQPPVLDGEIVDVRRDRV